ncbi:MAG: hypothetical protein JWM61_2512 [Micrococcaceae bacterium]|nr:hypothetical protein [Micrococcaceae bacterium]
MALTDDAPVADGLTGQQRSGPRVTQTRQWSRGSQPLSVTTCRRMCFSTRPASMHTFHRPSLMLNLEGNFESCSASEPPSPMRLERMTTSGTSTSDRTRGRARSPWSAGRRWFTIILVSVTALIGGPALAQASFINTANAVATVGTYDIPASASMSTSVDCTKRANERTMTITITGFARVDKATSYTLTLSESGTNSAPTTMNLTATQTTATIRQTTTPSAPGRFTLNLTARVGTWVSNTSLTQTLTCP